MQLACFAGVDEVALSLTAKVRNTVGRGGEGEVSRKRKRWKRWHRLDVWKRMSRRGMKSRRTRVFKPESSFSSLVSDRFSVCWWIQSNSDRAQVIRFTFSAIHNRVMSMSITRVSLRGTRTQKKGWLTTPDCAQFHVNENSLKTEWTCMAGFCDPLD